MTIYILETLILNSEETEKNTLCIILMIISSENKPQCAHIHGWTNGWTDATPFCSPLTKSQWETISVNEVLSFSVVIKSKVSFSLCTCPPFLQ